MQLVNLGNPRRWRWHSARKRRYNYKSTLNHVPEHYNLQNERCEELKLRKYKIIFDYDTKERFHQNYASKREYLSHSHTGYKICTINYIFIFHRSIRTENGVCHVVISAQVCTTFVLLYFCHFHRKNKDSREQSNHVSCRAPTPYQCNGMWWWDRTLHNPPGFLFPLHFIKKRTEWDFLREPFPLSTLVLYFLREFIWTFML
jgi:hypothetical protein